MFSERLLLNQIFHNASDFELKVLKYVRFRRNTCIQKIVFWIILLLWIDYFRIFCAFIESKNLKSKINNLSDFHLPNFQHVGFYSWIFTTCHIFNQLFKHASVFELNIVQRVIFWVYFLYILANFQAFTKTGYFSVLFQSMICVRLVKFLYSDGFGVSQ